MRLFGMTESCIKRQYLRLSILTLTGKMTTQIFGCYADVAFRRQESKHIALALGGDASAEHGARAGRAVATPTRMRSRCSSYTCGLFRPVPSGSVFT